MKKKVYKHSKISAQIKEQKKIMNSNVEILVGKSEINSTVYFKRYFPLRVSSQNYLQCQICYFKVKVVFFTYRHQISNTKRP